MGWSMAIDTGVAECEQQVHIQPHCMAGMAMRKLHACQRVCIAAQARAVPSREMHVQAGGGGL